MQRFLKLPALLFVVSAGMLAQQPVLRQYSVSNLPAASSNSGIAAFVKDGSSPSDCTVGGGTYGVTCQSNGTAWVAKSIVGMPIWVKKPIASTALTASATTQAVTVVTLAARQAVCGIIEKHSTAFTGTFSALTVTIGDSAGSATTYAPNPFDVKQTVSNTAFQANNVLGLASFAGGTVQANFTSTGANVSTQTGGSLDVEVCLVSLP